MKETELITGGVYTPSIKELRYAGRRLADALREFRKPDGNFVKARDDLIEARENCRKARDDAIDDARATIVTELDALVEKGELHNVLKAFPKYEEFRSAIRAVDEAIIKSRHDRNQLDQIYFDIFKNNLPILKAFYQDFSASVKVVFRLKWHERLNFLKSALLLGILASVIGGLIITYLYDFNLLPFIGRK